MQCQCWLGSRDSMNEKGTIFAFSGGDGRRGINGESQSRRVDAWVDRAGWGEKVTVTQNTKGKQD